MVSLHQLSMRFGAKILFKNVSLQLNPKCHYGLVGANGSGKSTLLKILIEEIAPEAGSVQIPNQTKIGALKQDHYQYEQEKILHVVLMGKPLLWKALQDKETILQHPHAFTDKECAVLMQCDKIIEEQKGYTAASEAAQLLEGLGIQGSLHERPLSVLSGGYKLRVLLAQLLFGQPDVLLLDEPTNHLDLYSIKWLENYLKQFPGTLLMSSHDRDFLNGVCTHILDVDCGTIKLYKGNYDAFLEQKAEGLEQKEALMLKNDKKREDLQEFIDRFGAKATKAKQAQSKAKIVEKLKEESESIDLTPSSRCYPRLNFVPARPSGAIPLVVQGINKAYGPKKVLENVAFEVERGERIAIIGPNGIGKSTLLEILTKHAQADAGDVKWGFGAHVGYFPQDHQREVRGDISLLDWLAQHNSQARQEQLRDLLGRVLFSGDMVNQPVRILSGGETARLILAKMMLQQPNVLIFDEPTNHLDMEAIDELTRILQQYEGTVLFVSHNRYFVSQLANRIIEITSQGVKDFKGTYLEFLEKEQVDHLAVPASLKNRDSKDNKILKSQEGSSYEEQKKWRNLKAQLRKKVAQAEEECHRLEAQIKKLDDLMGATDFYQKASREEQQEKTQQKRRLEDQLNEALARWELASLELQEQGGLADEC